MISNQHQRMCRRLINKLKNDIPDVHEQHINDAFQFAHEAHGEQLYVSGHPYFEHCLTGQLLLFGKNSMYDRGDLEERSDITNGDDPSAFIAQRFQSLSK